MARLEADASGNVVRFVASDRESMPTHPLAAASVSFDDLTNAATVADLTKSTDAYKIVAGAIQKNGSPVAIAADHPSSTDAKAVRNNQAAIFAALRGGTATNAQVQRVLAFLLRQYLQG